MSPELRELINKGKTTACCDNRIESLLWQLATTLERASEHFIHRHIDRWIIHTSGEMVEECDAIDPNFDHPFVIDDACEFVEVAAYNHDGRPLLWRKA